MLVVVLLIWDFLGLMNVIINNFLRKVFWLIYHLVHLFSGEMFIPFYTGRVIDILGSNYQENDFLAALIFMGLYSLGRYESDSVFPPHLSSVCSSQVTSNRFSLWLNSSVSAGCRGGLLTCAIHSFTCRIKVMLFGALTKQEIGFFETIKTGKAICTQRTKHVR